MNQTAEHTLTEEFDELRSVEEYGLRFRTPKPGEVQLFLVPDFADAQAEELSPHDLTCTQEVVSDLAVERWAAEQQVPPVIILSINGELLILDGHHRACAAVSMGRKLPCYVVRR